MLGKTKTEQNKTKFNHHKKKKCKHDITRRRIIKTTQTETQKIKLTIHAQ